MDHSNATVCRFGGVNSAAVQIHSHTSLQRLHHRPGGWEAGGNAPQDAEFFRRIAGSLEHTAGIVLIGPGNAKSAFKTFIDEHHPDLESHILAVETADHDDEALLSLGRDYFQMQKPPR